MSKLSDYKVRVELEVISSRFCEITVKATSKQEAIEEAIRQYYESDSLDYWDGESEEDVDESTKQDWEVETVTSINTDGG